MPVNGAIFLKSPFVLFLKANISLSENLQRCSGMLAARLEMQEVGKLCTGSLFTIIAKE